MSRYFGVIGNRDYIKRHGESRPYWEYLDRQPDGWLTSLVYARSDLPERDGDMECNMCGSVFDAHRHWRADLCCPVCESGDIGSLGDQSLIESVGNNMSAFYSVINQPDYVKIRGDKTFWGILLDIMPEGFLSSLAYKRKFFPSNHIPMIWDCGAWSYKDKEIPRIGKNDVTPEWTLEEYQQRAEPGDFVVAPDHMLIEAFGNLDFRRHFNRESAIEFLEQNQAMDTGLIPMAAAHGVTLDERVQYAEWLYDIGYRAIALGGLAGRASAKRSNIEIVGEICNLLPDVWLHVLGLSSPDYARAWYRLGVDSFDGASHFKQAFTAGIFFTEDRGQLTKHKAARTDRESGEVLDEIVAPLCDCRACSLLREEGIDTRTYGSNENNMGRAAHNQNMLMRAHAWHMRPWWVLVSCVGKKRDEPAAAKDLYQSPWFHKARAYAEHVGDNWAILSAMYGLLDKEWVIEPYEQTLNTMTQAGIKAWAALVVRQINETIPAGAHLIILAGRRYREFVLPELSNYTVEVPMEGLGIGEQLAWLDANLPKAQQLSFWA